MAREIRLEGVGCSSPDLRGLLLCFTQGWASSAVAAWEEVACWRREGISGGVRQNASARELFRRELLKNALIPKGQGIRLDRWMAWAAETSIDPLPINTLLLNYLHGDEGAGLQLLMLTGGEDFRTPVGFVALGNLAFQQGQNMARWAFLTEAAGINPAWVGRFFLGRGLVGDALDEPDETRASLEVALSVLWATGCFLSPLDVYPWVMQAGKPVGRWDTRSGLREATSDPTKDFIVDAYDGLVFEEGDLLNWLWLFRARVPEMRQLTKGAPREGHLLDVTPQSRALAMKIFGDFPDQSRITTESDRI